MRTSVFRLSLLCLLLLPCAVAFAEPSLLLQRARAVWAEAGGATSIEQLQREPVPDAQNAAVLLGDAAPHQEPQNATRELVTPEAKEAFQKLSDFYDERPKLHYKLQGLSGEDLQTVQALLEGEALQALFERAKQASRLPYFDSRIDFNSGPDMIIPNIGTFLSLAKVQCLHAELACQGGHYENALEDLAATIRLARLIRQQHLLVTQLTAVATESIALAKLADLSREPGLLKAIDQDFLALLKPADWHESMRKTLDIEYFFITRWGFEELEKDPAFYHTESLWLLGEDPHENPLFVLMSSIDSLKAFYWDYDEAFFTWHISQARKAIGKSAEQLLALDNSQREQIDEALITPHLSQLFSIDFGRFILSFVEADARIHLTRLSILLNRYQLEHGHYPDSLAALPTEIPNDPFTNAPFQYKRQGETFLLYSIGQDLVNNDGAFDPELDDDAEGQDLHWHGRGSAVPARP